MDLSEFEVLRLIDEVNAARRSSSGDALLVGDAAQTAAGQALEAKFRTCERLAVYGTLAPGEPNHYVVAPLKGEWTSGTVEGILVTQGWGSALGYPAFLPRHGGPSVAVRLLTTPALPAAWPLIDDFEGSGYCRILVPVYAEGSNGSRQLHAVANLYAGW